MFYQERVDVQVNYLDNETSQALRNGEVIKSYVTEILDIKALNIEGYTLIGKEVVHLVVTTDNHHVEFRYEEDNPEKE